MFLLQASETTPLTPPPPLSVEALIGTGTGSGFWARGFSILGGY